MKKGNEQMDAAYMDRLEKTRKVMELFRESDMLSKQILSRWTHTYLTRDGDFFRDLWKCCNVPEELKVIAGFCEEVLGKKESVLVEDDLETVHKYMQWKDCALEAVREQVAKMIAQRTSEQVVIIYGCGNNGEVLIRYLSKYAANRDNILFCDQRAEQMQYIFHEYKVIAPQTLVEKYKGCVVYQTLSDKTVLEKVRAWACNHSIFFIPIPCYENNYTGDNTDFYFNIEEQYFDKELMKATEGEVFVDAGFFDGTTSELFCKWCEGKYSKIYALEANDKNCSNYLNRKNRIQDIQLIEAAAWSEDGELRFASQEKTRGKMTTGRVADEGEEVIKARSIDSILQGERCTFIKMDIEGAELSALKGAANTIRQYKPKLAISVYHKLEDIVEIPLYIHSLCGEYEFFLRHYASGASETILYARVKA